MKDRLFKTIHLMGIEDLHTTARYYQGVISRDKSDMHYGSISSDRQVDPLDLVIFMEPSLQEWYPDFHKLPCETIGYMIDTHLDLHYRQKMAPFFDRLYCAQKLAVDLFFPQKAEWLPFAYDSAQSEVRSGGFDFDVAFVGQWGLPRGARWGLLERVSAEFKMNPQRVFYDPKAMGKLYARSKIVINRSVCADLNMRVFEAMGAGSLLITDRGVLGMEDLFEENLHYIAYSTQDEACDKIRYYLKHPEKRLEIAIQGQREVMEKHTYQHRWNKIKNDLKLKNGFGSAPVRNYSTSQKASIECRMASSHGDVGAWLKHYSKVPWNLSLLSEGLRAFHRGNQSRQKKGYSNEKK